MIHRLGVVPVTEESILIAVSSPHRQAAWKAGEEALEECKAKVEIWKKEEFSGEGGIWRANRDGAAGLRTDKVNESESPATVHHSPFTLPTGDATRSHPLFEKGHGPVIHRQSKDLES